jgi:hypothetical protein
MENSLKEGFSMKKILCLLLCLFFIPISLFAFTEQEKRIYNVSYSVMGMNTLQNGANHYLTDNDIGAKLKIGLSLSKLSKVASNNIEKVPFLYSDVFTAMFVNDQCKKIDQYAFDLKGSKDLVKTVFQYTYEHLDKLPNETAIIMGVGATLAKINAFHFPMLGKRDVAFLDSQIKNLKIYFPYEKAFINDYANLLYYMKEYKRKAEEKLLTNAVRLKLIRQSIKCHKYFSNVETAFFPDRK